MNKLFKICLVIILYSNPQNIFSQQINIFNLGNLCNGYLLNPANVANNQSRVFLQNRAVYYGIEGAPISSMLTCEFNLPNSNSGVGFILGFDRVNIFNQFNSKMTYAKKLTLNPKSTLSLGSSFGVKILSIDFNKVNAFENNDPIIFSSSKSSTTLDADFGLNYKVGKMNFNFSIFQLFNNKSTFLSNFEEKKLFYTNLRHYLSSVGFDFKIKNSNFVFNPILQARSVQGLNIVPELFLNLKYNNKINFGLNYRYKEAYGAAFSINFLENYYLAYAYEMPNNAFHAYGNNNHELLFGLNLTNKKDNNVGGSEKAIKELKLSYDERLELMANKNKQLTSALDSQKIIVDKIEKQVSNLTYDETVKLVNESKTNIENSDNLLIVEKVLFDINSSVLKSTYFQILNETVDRLNENPKSTIEIKGFADSFGELDKNFELRKKRNQAVFNYFIFKNISPNRIKILDFGENNPIRDNNSESNRAENRRVEVYFKN